MRCRLRSLYGKPAEELVEEGAEKVALVGDELFKKRFPDGEGRFHGSGEAVLNVSLAFEECIGEDMRSVGRNQELCLGEDAGKDCKRM